MLSVTYSDKIPRLESFKYVLSHEPVAQIRNKWIVIFTVSTSLREIRMFSGNI